MADLTKIASFYVVLFSSSAVVVVNQQVMDVANGVLYHIAMIALLPRPRPLSHHQRDRKPTAKSKPPVPSRISVSAKRRPMISPSKLLSFAPPPYFRDELEKI